MAPGRGKRREDRLLWKRPFSAKWSGGNEANAKSEKMSEFAKW